MPIYEFKCMKCNEFFEILFTSTQDAAEMKCTHCDSPDIERVLSSTNFSVSSVGAGPSAQTRTCSSGSCTTYDIPGPR